MANWVKSTAVLEKHGLSKAILGQKHKIGFPWIRKPAGTIDVDIDHPDCKAWLQKAEHRSIQHRTARAIATGFVLPEPAGNSVAHVPAGASDFVLPQPAGNRIAHVPAGAIPEMEIEQLAERAQRAKLEEPILKNEGYRLKHEQDRIKLQKEAGNLIEWELAQFLFTGYLERINTETLMFPKKFENKIEQMIHDLLIRSPIISTITDESTKTAVIEILNQIDKKSLARELVKLNIREHEEIIRTVKAAQQDDIANWNEERNR